MTDIQAVSSSFKTPDGVFHDSYEAAVAHTHRGEFARMATRFADTRDWAAPVRTRAINTIVDFLVFMELDRGQEDDANG